ncbi:WD40-repeat-containing domain protein [Mycotypha africana]|uniref:WD40-repeat-containing domain protein n=1 Tax=Mycotypha africana TaxID=64632 RepID=UPI0023004B44|nr:WD40-repeat-containing domain protein [Mycotypha africana]KAI8987658.1 WD40-repeat-containing domain protein [Mycotypha africana]
MQALTPTPDPNYGTIAELNGNLVHVENEHNPLMEELRNNSTHLYPSISVTPLKNDPADFDNTHLMDVDSNFYDATVKDIKAALRSQWDERRPMLESLPIYKPAKQLFDYVYKNYLQENNAMKEHLQFEREQTNVLKCLAWHPHQDRLAVGHGDNQVYVYEKLDNNLWICQVLSHQKMQHIRCMEWKRNAGGTLAVGCKEGVCVWKLPKTTADDQQPKQTIRYHPSATMRYLTYHNQSYISSIAWDPTPGSQLLATVSATSSTLVVHDLLLNRTIPLKRYGRGGNHILQWSPSGEWLFVGGSGGISRLWDTRSWDSRPINNPAGLWVQAACWSVDSRTLFYSMSGKSTIHLLHITGTPAKSTIIENEILSMPATTINSVSGTPTEVGGVIRDMCIDPRNGQRLSVAFENSELIAIYSVKQITPSNMHDHDMLLSLTSLITNQAPIYVFASGFIRGANIDCSTELLSIKALKDTKPIYISYSSTFKGGALLAIAWDNGLISFVTQNFLTDEEVRKRII